MIALWIAYKKKYLWRIDTANVIWLPFTQVVNCLQKKIPLKDWHPFNSSKIWYNGCELLTKKNTFEGLTPNFYVIQWCYMLWIAYKKKYLWRIDTNNIFLILTHRVVNCLQKKIPLKDWHQDWWKGFEVPRCELLTKKNTFEGLTPGIYVTM